MLLETERLVLRRPTPGDVARVGELVSDAEVMRFLGGATVPKEAWPDVLAKWLWRWEVNGVGPFVIERRADGVFVGRAGIMVWDTRDWTQSTYADAGAFAQPELGWALVRKAWGNGYMTEAAGAVRDWVRIDGLVSVIAPENVASQGVARRLGATPSETVTLFDSGPAVVWRYPR